MVNVTEEETLRALVASAARDLYRAGPKDRKCVRCGVNAGRHDWSLGARRGTVMICTPCLDLCWREATGAVA